MKKYCPNCGAECVYTTVSPKFCSSCGEPFDSSVTGNKSSALSNSRITSLNASSSFEGERNSIRLGDILSKKSGSSSVARSVHRGGTTNNFSKNPAEAIAQFFAETNKELDKQYGPKESTEDSDGE